MTVTLRKAVCFGEFGVISPSAGNQQYLGYQPSPGTYTNLNLIADSSTRWVRIWCHLSSLWPSPGGLNVALRDEVDYQLALAKAYGCGTILSIHHDLPDWINQGAGNARLVPANLELDGPWASMFASLASRYSRNTPNKKFNNQSQADIIEFCNEPNQLWQEGSRDLVGGVATLFKRAKQIVASYGHAPLVAGPSVADLGPDRLAGRRNYHDFTGDVLNRLAGNGFYDVGLNQACIWSIHNYTDVT